MLNYTQKTILTAFEKFYGFKYSVNKEDIENNTIHNLCQSLCYLLKTLDIEVGEYDYTLNYNTPYSPGLLATLRKMDRNEQEINEFYNNQEQDNFLSEEKLNLIEKLKNNLNIKNHENDIIGWIKEKSTLTYYSIGKYPNADIYSLKQKYLEEEKKLINTIATLK